MVYLTLHQVTSILDGPLYHVKNEITAFAGIDPNAFVFRVSDSAFDHYATSADYSVYPTTRDAAIAAGLGFYRQSKVERDWPNVAAMNLDLCTTQSRLQQLVRDWNTINGTAVIDQTVTLSSE